MITFTDRNAKAVTKWDSIAADPSSFWDGLSPVERQHLFENKFYSFKSWGRLSEQERRRIQQIAKNHADSAFICGAIQDVNQYLAAKL